MSKGCFLTQIKVPLFEVKEIFIYPKKNFSISVDNEITFEDPNLSGCKLNNSFPDIKKILFDSESI